MALPLTDKTYNFPSIPEYSDTGCKNLLLNCPIEGNTKKQPNEICNAIDVNKNGHIINVDGECHHVTWNNNKWNISKNKNDEFKCIPTSKLPKGNKGAIKTILSNVTSSELYKNKKGEYKSKNIPKCNKILHNTNDFSWELINKPVSSGSKINN